MKSFSIKVDVVDKIYTDFKKNQRKQETILWSKISAATNIVYNTARARRPYVNMVGKMRINGMKTKGKIRGVRRVSDPQADYGVPVRTGELRASIEKKMGYTGRRIRGEVYTTSPYAQFLEFGTSKMEARPFMRPALYINQETIKKIFQKENA